MGETGPPPPPVVLAGEAILTLFGMVGAVPRVDAVKEEEEHPKTAAIGTESDGLTIPYVLDAATLFLHRNLYMFLRVIIFISRVHVLHVHVPCPTCT